MALIFVIEDNPQVSRLAAKLLRAAGHEVTIAETGESGLSISFDHPPDLVLVDLGLPDLDGQTVIALLHQQANTADVPIIAFTAWPEASAHSMAKAYGCDGVIIKPMNTRTFVTEIEAHLKRPPTDDADKQTVPHDAINH